MPHGPRASVRMGDARAIPAEDASVDLILTSPPYINAIDYLRTHKFSLLWMGHRLEALRELRGTMIGTERGLWTMDGLPTDLERRLGRMIEKPRRRAIARRYLSDLQRVLREIERVLTPDGAAILVMGPTILSSTRTDAERVLAELGSNVGLRVVTSTIRALPAARRSLPPPYASRGDALGLRVRREVIVALRK